MRSKARTDENAGKPVKPVNNCAFSWRSPHAVDKLQKSEGTQALKKKCSPWNTFVERQLTDFSICGKLFLVVGLS